MTDIVNQAPVVTWELDVSAPMPMRWYVAGDDNIPTARGITVTCTISYANITPVVLTVGDGIVLETYEGVASSLVVTTPLSSQLANFPIGAQLNAEWAEGSPLAVILRGILLTV
jgi:hypothetical protein